MKAAMHIMKKSLHCKYPVLILTICISADITLKIKGMIGDYVRIN